MSIELFEEKEMELQLYKRLAKNKMDIAKGHFQSGTDLSRQLSRYINNDNTNLINELKETYLKRKNLQMYNVIVPSKVSLEFFAELDFCSQKNETFAEKVAVELDFHLTQTLKHNPGFGALKSKKSVLFYYLIQGQFKLVFEIDKLNNHPKLSLM